LASFDGDTDQLSAKAEISVVQSLVSTPEGIGPSKELSGRKGRGGGWGHLNMGIVGKTMKILRQSFFIICIGKNLTCLHIAIIYLSQSVIRVFQSSHYFSH
jgi:hypothetical protein